VGLLAPEGLRRIDTFAAVVMAVGLFFVFLKIGRKARFLLVLLRPHSSWMTRETWCVAGIYPALAVSYVWPQYLHGSLALLALAAAGFLLCQARILYASKGIPAWRAPLIPAMVIASGLAEGLGLLAMLSLFPSMQVAPIIVLAPAGLLLVIINSWAWRCYVDSAKAMGIGPLARRDLEGASPWVHTFGHGIPLTLYLLCLAVAPISQSLAALAGLGAVIGGAVWKFIVITRACHQQGFAIPMQPQRGSGKRAAPKRFVLN
jgi:phenylacetyl-CoA:acceptor oxidoreductase subunit 2